MAERKYVRRCSIADYRALDRETCKTCDNCFGHSVWAQPKERGADQIVADYSTAPSSGHNCTFVVSDHVISRIARWERLGVHDCSLSEHNYAPRGSRLSLTTHKPFGRGKVTDSFQCTYLYLDITSASSMLSSRCSAGPSYDSLKAAVW